jgi:UDP-glucose 4-epimerase
MSRYLVTGGAGFIGSHMVEALLAEGHAVRIIDDLSTGKCENLFGGAECIEASICDGEALASALEGIDGVFHLAAIASVHKCIAEWQASSAVNLLGSIDVFERASTLGIPVVYASSAAVYGDQAEPCKVTTQGKPLSAYGVDKYAMELHSAAGTVTRGARSFGLRFFNIYGPRQDPSSPYSGVIAIFMDRLMKGQGIQIFGDGLQSRDFVYVGDAVAAMRAAMCSLEDDPSARAEVENVGTGLGVDLNMLARTIGEVVGQAVDTTYAAARAGDIRYSVADPSKVLADLGAHPQASLHDGLSRLHASLIDP